MHLISNSLHEIRHFCFDANPYPIGRRGLRRNRNVWRAASSELSHYKLEFTPHFCKKPPTTRTEAGDSFSALSGAESGLLVGRRCSVAQTQGGAADPPYQIDYAPTGLGNLGGAGGYKDFAPDGAATGHNHYLVFLSKSGKLYRMKSVVQCSK
jgi:hypothetical protein